MGDRFLGMLGDAIGFGLWGGRWILSNVKRCDLFDNENFGGAIAFWGCGEVRSLLGL